jgi:hypothetical protein
MLDWKSGRCTSFAIKVVHLLNSTCQATFSFDFYNLHGHRLARCRKTESLIDSSSMHGAFQLKAGEWKTFEDDDKRWKWVKGKSRFETSRPGSLVRDRRSIISVKTCFGVLIWSSRKRHQKLLRQKRVWLFA